MKRLSVLLVATLLLAGCGSAPKPEATASASPVTLTQWIKDAGFTSVLSGLAAAVTEISDAMSAAGTDTVQMAKALRPNGETVAALADQLAAEPASKDAGYEKLRNELVIAMRAYASAASSIELTSGATQLAGVTDAFGALTALSQAITLLSAYLSAHGNDETTAK